MWCARDVWCCCAATGSTLVADPFYSPMPELPQPVNTPPSSSVHDVDDSAAVGQQTTHCSRGVVGRVRVEWTASPTFFDRWGRLPQFFGLKLVQKLVNCCNWLLIETWCKIFSRYSRINVAAKASICCIQSHTNTCIAGQDQRPAVASFLTCMSVRVCRPELYLYYKPFV